MNTTVKSAIEVQVHVKPVFVSLVHAAAYEGPCRVGKPKDLVPEADRKWGREGFKGFVSEMKDKLSPPAKMLEPVLLEWGDDFVVSERELAKLAPDIYDADLVLLTGGLPQYPAVRIAEKYRRPVGQIGWVTSVDITANLRARGLEGYAFWDYDDLNEFINLLQVRKAFRNTHVMIGAEGDTLPSVGVVSSIVDLPGLLDRYGVRHTHVNTARFLEEMDNLPSEAVNEVQSLTTSLMKNAQACHMTRENVEPSVGFFVATKRLLAKHEANAFVIPCFEVCATQVMEQRRVMFCLTHSLLKSMGIPSACEGDTNVLMAIALLTYVGKKAVYMGNTWGNRDENILSISHDVAGFKMQGLDLPDGPYELRNFTEGGWGVTVRYDFTRDKGTPVTLARFDPTGTRVLVASGEIVGGQGFDQISCSLGVHVRINDVRDFFEKQMDFGHHMAMIYGEYTDAIHRLSQVMGFEVVESK